MKKTPTPTSQDPDTAPSRREFLKVSAATAGATLLASCFGGGGGSSEPALIGAIETDPLSCFDHLVVVMFENRSFDNLLGYLYPAGTPFEGLSGHAYANPGPTSSVPAQPSKGTDSDMRNPKPDPGEGYVHTNVQLFGPLGTPYNAPVAGQAPTMQGFVADYYAKLVAGGKDPSYDDYRVIMDAFTSAQLPVLSTLARSFAVFDHWFCAVPSQTYCNRAFFNASTSAGQVENRNWKPVAAPTIFNRLDGLTKSPFDGSGALRWAIYGDGTHSLTSLIHWPAIGKYCGSNVLTMDRFRTDAQNGTLPLYAFIEPRFSRSDATCNSFHPPHDVRLGDALLHDVYMAVRNGKNADRTLLLVTFDEHGGCYDHVPPWAATPPGDGADGQYGFKFDRLGVRVPTIAISSRTPAGRIIGTPMHPGAVARTLCEKYGLPPLTARDASAPSLAEAIDPATMRAPSSWPVTTPASIPAEAAAGDPSAPLDELHEEFVSLAVSVLAGRALNPGDPDFPATVGAAQALLESLPKTCTFSG